MAKHEKQKIKLLKLFDILRTESDAAHPMSTNDLIERLAEVQIPCERKSLASDIALLNEYGYGVQVKRAKQNMYYIEKRDLDIHTIRFLVDATQSAVFLSKEQTQEIVATVAMLAGTNKAEVLEDNVLYFDKLKHSNDEVLKIITELDRAIENRRKVSFEYHLMGVDGKPHPKLDGSGAPKRYTGIPIALMFNNGFYYLIVFQEKYGGYATYRIDRMRSVKVAAEALPSERYTEQFKRGDLKNAMTAFGMWIGKTKRVEMCFRGDHAGDVFDKFGKNTVLHPLGDGRFRVAVDVNPDDPVFLGWCMSYGKELEIVSPPEVRAALAEKAKEVLAVNGGE